jgi:hypothetical protein
MKSFADNSFYMLFEAILRKDKPKDGSDTWTTAGATWHHSRHSFETDGYGFAIEIYEIVSTGRNGWTLLVAREHWWAGRKGEVIRSAHWAKPMRGNRAAIIAWLKVRQQQLDSEYDQDRLDSARAR